MEGLLRVPLEGRLEERYVALVKQHQHVGSSTAAGPAVGVASPSSLAAAQGMWRFLHNQRVTLGALATPLREAGRRAWEREGSPLALLVHDWSKIDYASHASKRDRVVLTHERDVGYELAAALLVSGQTGDAWAPMQMHLKTSASAMLSTARGELPADTPRLDQATATMEASSLWGLPGRVVHVIDREADSVGHYRRWHAKGHLFLVRGDDRKVLRQVDGREREMLLSQVVAGLEAEGALIDTREVEYHGKRMRQRVAQTTVTLHRPARTRVDGRQREVPGEPLTLRLVVAQVVDAAGRVRATWLLLTHVDEADADAAQVALWYYWRWRIESFFKLLKSAGQRMEEWQQTTGEAVAKRLLIASMACVLAWNLQRDTSPQGVRMQRLLVRLSGRQTKRSRPVTTEALLAGLFVLLPMLELLESCGGDPNEIPRLAAATLPRLHSGSMCRD